MFHPQGPTFWELAEQALSSTERGYDLLAPKFDYTPFRTPDAILRRVAPTPRAAAPLPPRLDPCCGAGARVGMLPPPRRERGVGPRLSRGVLFLRRHRLRE